MATSARVRVGTCGWTDPTLIKAGTFYPPGATSAEERLRYYRYQVQELREWVPRIGYLAENAAEVHSLMSNCYSDHAVVNGRQLSALLHGEDPGSAAEQLRIQAQQPGT